MIDIEVLGNTAKLDAFLSKMIDIDPLTPIDAAARRGVAALADATPRESGVTAASWDYEIVRDGNGVTVWWTNSHVVNGFNVVIGLQYGHGTGTGGYVAGEDFINPVLKPIFDSIADEIWKEVQNS